MPSDSALSPAQKVAVKVIEILEVFAHRGNHFTFPQLRQLAGIDAKSNDNTHLWNLWRSMEDAEVLEQLDTGRKRNRIFRVAKPERLNVFMPMQNADLSELKTNNRPSVEERLSAVEDQLAEIRALVSQLRRQ